MYTFSFTAKGKTHTLRTDRKVKHVVEYHGGVFIPEFEDEFLKDMQPVEQDENVYDEDAERFNRWYEANVEQELLQHEINY